MRALLIAVLLACGGPGAMGPMEPLPSDPLTFDVPAHTRSFTLVVQDEALAGFTSPSGQVFTRGKGSTQPGFTVVTYPAADDGITTAGNVAVGRWTVQTTGLAPTVLLQNDGPNALLDVDFYVPQGLQVDSLTDRVDEMYVLFSRLYGLERGDVQMHDIDARFGSISGQDAVDAANEQATSGRLAAQVVLTNHLDPDGNGDEISGLSNCLPGAPGVPGTPCSAVIVSMRSAAWIDAATLVHELSHFMQLFHTTEFDGTDDGLADTPHCTDMSKAALANCPDVNNLMFPTELQGDVEANLSVSPTQRAVVRASPLYRASN